MSAHSVRAEADSAEEDYVSAEIAAFSPLGIVTGDRPGGRCVLEAWFVSAAEAAACAEALAAWNPAIHESPDAQDWNAAWQSAWIPIEAGGHWFLAPPAFAGETPPGRIRLDMHPGTLFGNGAHPTTLLCLEAMEDCVKPGVTFLDIGCGSGLLTHAASLLGARAAIGCDLDPRAAQAASRFGAGAFIGSADAVRPGSLDVIAANIQLGVLRDILPAIVTALSARGAALLSGVLADQRSDLISAIESAGLRPCATKEQGGWLLAWAGGPRGSGPP